MRDTEGKRFNSSSVNSSGRSTMPWIRRRYSLGSMSGTMAPRWVPTKWSEDGVIIPTESCSGVKHVKRQAEVVGRKSFGHGYAYRGHEMGALAIGDQLLETFFRLRLRCRRLTACCATPPTAKPATAAPPFRNFLRLGFFESMGLSFAAFFHFLPSAPFFRNFRH